MLKTSKKAKILTVIVTHNRKDLLRRCILNLLKQTYSCLEIIVINNGSTDGTKEMLVGLGIKSIDQDNLGAASGWFKGLELAVNGNYDYCWLMDDDGYPDSEALGRLIRSFGEDISCCASTVLQEENKEYFVFPYPKLNKKNLPILFNTNRKFYTLNQINKAVNSNYYPYAHFFNGTLIKVSAVRKIGNIQKNFVIYGEELDFFYRLRDFGKVITVLDAYHYHPNVKQRPYSDKKIFFYIRNSLFINNKYLDKSTIRNVLTLLVAIYRIIKRNGIVELIKLLFWSNNGLFYFAIYYGLKGDLNKKKHKIFMN